MDPRTVNLPVPSGFELALDVSPADWIVDEVKPWGGDRVRAWSFLPAIYERYARVLHPIHRRDEYTRGPRWGDLAAARGVSLRPDISFREVSGVDPSDQAAWDIVEPMEGNLDPQQLSALTRALAAFTATSERCWIAAWDGWGSWGPGSSATLVAVKNESPRFLRLRPLMRRSTRRSLGRSLIEQKSQLAPIPRIAIPHRAYFLFKTRMDLVPSFEVGGWPQAPSIWWPDDRAWCVATEVDGYSTYVGGSSGCIGAILASHDVEAIEVPADVPMDPGPYRPADG